MRIPDRIDTESVECSFITARTPMSLASRLTEDQVSIKLSQSMSGEDLLRTFESSLSRDPEIMRDLITPYLALTAMWLKQDARFLDDASAVHAPPHFKWLTELTRILVDSKQLFTNWATQSPGARHRR
jgi:hypothetical protein